MPLEPSAGGPGGRSQRSRRDVRSGPIEPRVVRAGRMRVRRLRDADHLHAGDRVGTARMTKVGWVELALAALGIGCAAAPSSRVELCSPPAERPARPAPECFWAAESRRYAGRLGSLIGDTLCGWRSHPGAAELSATFDDQGRVASVCFDSVSGDAVARRVPEVAIRARDLPAAPGCFAGHRLDFAWESEVATSEEVRQVLRTCRREVSPLKRRIDWCRVAQHCSVNEVLEREAEADRELRSCVLEGVPLAMRTGISREVMSFVPVEGEKPDPELALRAHHVCDGLPRRVDVIECMDRHGWRPGE